MSDTFLPYGRQSIDQSDIDAVIDVLKSDWLTTGPAVRAFEEEFEAVTGAPHARACSNGTTALHLALAALGVDAGDIAIVPAITFMATANAALYCGADVVFADVDPHTGLMTPDSLAQAIDRAGGRAKAVLPVHLAGQICDMPAIEAIARAAGAVIVEDSCHAIGTTAPWGAAGNCAHADAATFSFHPVKTIAAGEGGLVTTPSADLARAIDVLRSHGIERDPALHQRQEQEPWWHEMQVLGWNYRLSDIQAALAKSQLHRLAAFKAKRQALAAAYDAALADLAPLAQPIARVAGNDACLHLYAARIDFAAAGRSRSEVMSALRERGIGTQVHYIPVPDQPYYKARYGHSDLPGAQHYYERTLSLPLYQGMSESDPVRVVEALKAVLGV
ncbi:UDP-4-amino-4,6-dideoxy-N-acetyl-beta-L-altrosamine transaminase [Maricaulis sp.]|uniref:UDP-4-amino-4, 6-dideoxy-N-acetyl-beta-L-altrosamine transaminase n=1 Tax=Maricaulis sp. TaxID=1486257 RepID=UPI002622D7C9|nr:UDP-4-amino-4,6-dideoxy-N-acetyl-beta-L-altrosamine transaminase [Maricaulis sp.]